MTAEMRRIAALTMTGLLFGACTDNSADGQAQPEITTGSIFPAAQDSRFARLKEASFEQPLPDDLTLIVLTAVEQHKGDLIEMIDPQLTNAEDGTGFVVTYLLYPPDADPEAKFKEATSTLPGAEAEMVDLDVTERTKCIVSPDAGHCVTGADDYFIQSSYLPGEAVDDMEVQMTEIVRAAIAHYEIKA